MTVCSQIPAPVHNITRPYTVQALRFSSYRRFTINNRDFHRCSAADTTNTFHFLPIVFPPTEVQKGTLFTVFLYNINMPCYVQQLRFLTSLPTCSQDHKSPQFGSLLFTFPWVIFRSWCTQWMRRASCTSDTSCAAIPAGSRGLTSEVKTFFGRQTCIAWHRYQGRFCRHRHSFVQHLCAVHRTILVPD